MNAFEKGNFNSAAGMQRFWEGHDFSRAAEVQINTGLQPLRCVTRNN